VTFLVDNVLRDARAGVAERDDIARYGTHDHEREDRDADERWDHEQEPPDDVAPHRASLGRLPLVR
jgi:hypothetical protein